MKKVIMFLGAMCLLVLSTNAQAITDVPTKVVKSFEGKYASVDGLQWEQEKEGNWEASFTMNNQDYTAFFTNEGEWKYTSQNLSAEDVPDNLTSMLESEMLGYEIDQFSLIESPKGNYYKVTVDVDGKKYKVKADMDGNVIEKKMKGKEKDGLK